MFQVRELVASFAALSSLTTKKIEKIVTKDEKMCEEIVEVLSQCATKEKWISVNSNLHEQVKKALQDLSTGVSPIVKFFWF